VWQPFSNFDCFYCSGVAADNQILLALKYFQRHQRAQPVAINEPADSEESVISVWASVNAMSSGLSEGDPTACTTGRAPRGMGAPNAVSLRCSCSRLRCAHSLFFARPPFLFQIKALFLKLFDGKFFRRKFRVKLPDEVEVNIHLLDALPGGLVGLMYHHFLDKFIEHERGQFDKLGIPLEQFDEFIRPNHA
jgi:hypothetical protein